MANILIVEDNVELKELLQTVLLTEGFSVFCASNGLDAITLMEHHQIDLLVSDIMMPQMDGYELTKFLRSTNQTVPILLITALDQFKHKETGFIAGIDDYMVKPVDMAELILRVKALLRRANIAQTKLIQIGNSTLDYDSFTLTTNHHVQELKQKEFLLLYKLCAMHGKILTRQQLFDDVWGLDSETSMHTLDVHISRLRERIKDNTDFEIVTVRGLGYKVVVHCHE